MSSFKENRDNRLYETRKMKCGMNATIIEYDASNKITVQFEDGYITPNNREYKKFIRGEIGNPYARSVSGVGYVGEGKYHSREMYVGKNRYADAWYDMLKRCYNEKHQILNPTYIGCKVEDNWHCLQNFAKWFENNIWTTKFTLCVDKDILNKGNKLYSENNCILVDGRINVIFQDTKNKRGKYPIGVKKLYNNKFVATISKLVDGNRLSLNLGTYDTKEEAFYAYKKEKEKYIKYVADEYKSKYQNFPQKLYDAMYNWKIEITD